MQDHIEEVRCSIQSEGVMHEQWYLGHDDSGRYLIGVMDAPDHAEAAEIALQSSLAVDKYHQQFKQHWLTGEAHDLRVARATEPVLSGVELLLDVRA